jgi:hypothetical protein
MTPFEHSLLILLAILTFSQFVTMLVNLFNNLMHYAQMRDVRMIRESAAVAETAEKAWREEIIADLREATSQITHLRRTLRAVGIELPSE